MIRDEMIRDEIIGEKVIVRTFSAGVHYGTLLRRIEKEVLLGNARRLWYWEGAASLSELSLSGTKNPTDCKFSVKIPLILLTEAIEIIPCTHNATISIEGVLEWKA